MKRDVTSVWRVSGTSKREKRLSEPSTPAHILFVFYVCVIQKYSHIKTSC